MSTDEYLHKIDIEHNLRIYQNSYIVIQKDNRNIVLGKLLGVEYDAQAHEFYALLFNKGIASRLYESEIAEIITGYGDKNSAIIYSVRTILAEEYILWDDGVITGKTGTFPVVNLINEGEAIRVDYCHDLSAKDVEFFEAFEDPSVEYVPAEQILQLPSLSEYFPVWQ